MAPFAIIRCTAKESYRANFPRPPLLSPCSPSPAFAPAQAPPTTYTVVQAIPGATAGTMTVYRSGAKAVIEYNHAAQADGTPASRSLTLYDLAAGASYTWDPAAKPIACSAGTFTGDWGDPYAMTAQLSAGIAKGDLKPAGAATLHGIPTKVYAGTAQGMNIKAWLDEKDGLVLRAEFGRSRQPHADAWSTCKKSPSPRPLHRSSPCPQPAPASSRRPPPPISSPTKPATPATTSSTPCMAPAQRTPAIWCSESSRPRPWLPITGRWQAAIDTTYNMDSPNPPSYEFGSATDGTSTFAGGGLHEITSQIHNDMLRIDNPPAYFNLATNFIQPGRGAGIGLIYRQCFAPITMLYLRPQRPQRSRPGGDFLYAKSGKYATVPAH